MRDKPPPAGSIRHWFGRVEPWLLGGAMVFPLVLQAVRWLLGRGN